MRHFWGIGSPVGAPICAVVGLQNGCLGDDDKDAFQAIFYCSAHRPAVRRGKGKARRTTKQVCRQVGPWSGFYDPLHKRRTG